MKTNWSKQILARNLRNYIAKTGKERKDVADELGFPYSTLTDWCNAKRYPRIDKIEIMAEYFGIQKSDLIEDKTLSPIKLMREEKHITLFELSEELGVPVKELQAYEEGSKEMPFSLAQKLAAYFNVNVESLYGVAMFDKGTTAFVSQNKREVELHTRWNDQVGKLDFTDEEHNLIILTAQFIKSIRGREDYETLLNTARIMIGQLKK